MPMLNLQKCHIVYRFFNAKITKILLNMNTPRVYKIILGFKCVEFCMLISWSVSLCSGRSEMLCFFNLVSLTMIWAYSNYDIKN